MKKFMRARGFMGRGRVAIPLGMLVTAFGTSGCGGAPSEDTFGQVHAEITAVPAAVACIRLTLQPEAGSATSREFDVTGGQRSVLDVGRLAPGGVTVSGRAYDVRCASVRASTAASWVAEAVTVVVRTGVTADIALVFRRNDGVRVSADFREVVRSVTTAMSTYALLSDGTVRAWGAGGYGQLGDGTTIGRNTPAPVQGLGDVVQVSTNRTGQHACALKGDGTVWCWGLNTYGQLGDGTTVNRAVPTLVSGLTGVVQVSTGSVHTCALRGDNTVWCWGWNNYGQLGDHTTTDRLLPVQVRDLSPVIEIGAGTWHTCGRNRLGQALCWGASAEGQHCAHTPSPTGWATATELTDLEALRVGENVTCGLRTDGTVRCCGSNNTGQLGDGTTTPRALPTPVVGLADVVDVALGMGTGCAVRRDGALFCWGRNDWAQLGDGTTDERHAPIQVPGLTGVTAVAPGHSYTCALLQDATLRCWGRNVEGALGDGTYLQRYRPTAPLL